MKGYTGYILLLTLLVAVLAPVSALASDVSNAEWIGTVRITNADTANTSVSVNCSINSDGMADNGYIADNLTDVAVLYNGVDVPFMPGANATYPWCFFVDSIGDKSNIDYELYTGGASGGNIVIFPDATGLTTGDDASLEGSDNFSLETKGRFDTAQTGANITYKTDAVRVFYGASGNITARFGGATTENINPTGTNDPDTAWSDDGQAIDNNTGTSSYITAHGAGSWTSYLECTFDACILTQVKFYADVTGTTSEQIDIDVYSNSAWNDVYQGAFDDAAWVTKSNAAFYGNATKIRARLYNPAGAARDCNLHEIEYTTGYFDISTSGIAADGYKLEVYADSSNWTMEIDDVIKASIDMDGAVMPDNANDWVDCQGTAMPYVEYIKKYVGGVLKQHIIWQNTSGDFTDQSGNSNDATPTYRTTSSDADVSAELLSLEPTEQSKVSTFTLSSTYEILSGNATTPSNMFDDGDYTKLPADPINDVLDAATVPRAAWWMPFLFFGICIIGFIIYGFTSMARGQNGKLVEGQIDGSLLVMFVVMEGLLVLFGQMGPIPYWPAFLFPIAGIAIILSRKHFSWG